MMEKILKGKNPDLINNKFKSIFFVGVLGWIVFLISGILDNVFAGQFLSETALGAVQIINPFYSFICFVSVLASAGFGVRYSNLFGHGDKEEAYKTVGMGVIFALSCSAIVALLMFFFKKSFLSIFNLSPEVYSYASDYYGWFIGVAAVYPMYMLFYRLSLQDGDAGWTFASDMAQVVVNAIASGVLVKIVGIKGLGLGTFLSIVAGLITVSCHFLTKKNSVRIKLYFSFKKLPICLKLGIGTALGTLFTAIVNMVMNSYVVRNFGDAYLSSFTIINLVIQFTMLFVCIPDSMGAFLSTANGSKNNDDLKKCISIEKKWSAIISLISTAIMCALCTVVPLLFGIKKSTEQYDFSVLAILIISPTFICYAYQICIGLTYVAIQKPTISLISQIVTNLILKLALPIALSQAFGFIGFIVGYGVLSVIGIAITCTILVAKHKTRKVFELPETQEIQFSEDLFLVEQNVFDALSKIKEKLYSLGVEKRAVICAIGTLDDIFHIVIRMNPNVIVTDRVTLCVSDDRVRIINKNNGRICSREEQTAENANALNHVYLTYFNQEGVFSLNTVISFNYATTYIERQKTII